MDKNNHDEYNPIEWVDKHGDYLYNYVLYRIHDKTVAEDLVQETFLAALKNIKTFSGKSSIRTWLTAILKNKIIDHFRKVSRELPLENDEKLFFETEEIFYKEGRWKDYWDINKDPLVWENNPEKNLEKKQFWDTFYKCLEELPPRFKAIFTLRTMEDLPTEKICKDLNVSSSNIWVILHRSRTQLRRCLEINWYGGKLFKRKL